MEFCHTELYLHSAAAKGLAEMVEKRRKKWAEQKSELLNMDDFEGFEQELHKRIMALECELVSDELSRYDMTEEEIIVDKKTYRRGRRSRETYLTAAGCTMVVRHLYVGVDAKDKSICPLELRSGMIAGYFTPRAARQGAFAMAHLTSGESEAMFGEIGNMQPSGSSLDRLTKALSPHWEDHRADWEAQLRKGEIVPAHAKVIAISVDGVMAPLRGADKQEKSEQPGKHASGPTGYKEVGCGTVSLYDQEAQRLQTVRYARMPESKKVTLQQQLETEVASILALRPTLLRVHLADGAKDNWRLMNDIETYLPETLEKIIEIVDYYHACDHLKKGCDAAWGESTPESQAYFERLKTKLKEADHGANLIIRVLRFQLSMAKGNRRKRLDAQLIYFRNQQHRMHYPDYIRWNLPIASGVMEASCKTLVTQRMKRSGMTWAKDGGQAILTLRSIIQSNRWQSAWSLLSADFRKTIKISKPHRSKIFNSNQTKPITLSPSRPVRRPNYTSLPLAE
jgi:hypothetical protein